MGDLVKPEDWADFKNVMRDAHDTFERKQIQWVRNKTRVNVNMEDSNNVKETVTLEVQLNYNYMRSWPITSATETGELDRQSIQLLANKQYLSELGYINTSGAFEYNPDLDRFIIDGLVYKSFGDTAVSQAHDDDILVSIILKREETKTGDQR